MFSPSRTRATRAMSLETNEAPEAKPEDFQSPKIFESAPLTPEQMSDSYQCVETPTVQLDAYEVPANEKFMVLGVADWQTLKIACDLAKKNNSPAKAQLVIIDSNNSSAHLWKDLKSFFRPRFTEEEVPEQVTNFLITQMQTPGRAFSEYESQFKSVLKFIDTYGYRFLREIILRTVYFAQTWDESRIFGELKTFIQLNGYQHLFVYTSTLPTGSREDVSLKILENIYFLRPRLAIHANLNINLGKADQLLFFENNANQPANVFESLTQAFIVEADNIPRFHRSGPFISRVPSVQQINTLRYDTLHRMLNRLRADEGYEFDQSTTCLLPEMVLRLAGIEINLTSCFIEQANHNFDVVFHLPISDVIANQYIKILNEKFPALCAGVPFLNQTKKRPGFPGIIVMDTSAVANHILPLIPTYFAEHPAVLDKFNCLASFHKIAKLFEKYNMSTYTSDCFEEILCLMVKEKLAPNDPALVTTTSVFEPHPTELGKMNMFITTPIISAQAIVNYFNSLQQGSATLADQPEFVAYKNATLTKITIAVSVILDERFIRDLTLVIERPEILARYQTVANPAQIAPAAESEQPDATRRLAF